MVSRLIFESETFRCPLFCERCTYVKGDGERCKNRVCFGTPICWIHTLKMYGVKIKVSTIPFGGKGLFSERLIPSGTWICPYVGDWLTLPCLEQRYPGEMNAPYTVRVGQRAVDSGCRRGIASMANGLFTDRGIPLPRFRHNAIILVRPRRNYPWLRATRDITEGEEIFVYYGREYLLDGAHDTRRSKRGGGWDTRPC